MKANQIVEPIISEDFSKVTFNVRGHESFVLEMDKLHPDVVKRAACVGMAQVRINDAAAIGRTDKEGRIIPEVDRTAMKYEAMKRLAYHYMTGTAEWAQRVAKGKAKGDGGELNLILRALAAVQELDVESMRKIVASKAEKRGITIRVYLNQIATSEAVRRKMDELRGPPAADADAMLAELSESDDEPADEQDDADEPSADD